MTTVSNSQDVFLCCLSPQGQVLWAQLFGGEQTDLVSDVKVNSQNEILLYGRFKGSIQLGAEIFQSKVNPTTGLSSYDLMLVKTNAQGNVVWSRHGKASRDNRSLQLAIDDQDHIYCTGIFSDTLQFMSIHPNQNLNIGFLMKWTTAGEPVWFRRVQSSVTEINGLDCGNNHVYITGNFSGIQRFAIGQGNAWQNLTHPAPFKYYIAAYHSDGAYAWSMAEGSNNFAKAKALVLLPDSSLAIAGEFSCQHSHFQSLFGDALYLSRGQKDIFVSAYTNLGSIKWVKQFGSIADDEVNDITYSQQGNPLFAGSFEEKFSAPSTTFWSNTEYSFHGSIGTPFCNDAFYHHYSVLSSRGDKDILIANVCDTARSTLDLFIRDETDSACTFAIKSGNIEQISGNPACGPAVLKAVLPTGSEDVNGPQFNFLWNTGSTLQSITIETSQHNHVLANAANSCYSFADSTFTIVVEPPPQPSISASGATILDAISQGSCLKKIGKLPTSTPLLSGNQVVAPFIGYWTLPGGNVVSAQTVEAPLPGVYTYTVAREDSTCAMSACVRVFNYNFSVGQGVPGQCNNSGNPLRPLFIASQPFDTLYGCPGFGFYIHLVDSINYQLGIETEIDLFAYWKRTGPFEFNSSPLGANHTFQQHKNFFKSTGSGPASVRPSFLVPPNNADTMFV